MVIDARGDDYEAKNVNHSCSPNARYVTIRLNRSSWDVVFVEVIADVDVGSKIVVDYGWSLVDSNNLAICECNSSSCKGCIYSNELSK